ETKGYRGWWYYLMADAAMALYEASGDGALLETARDSLKRAAACCLAISWLARLARTAQGESGEAPADEVTALAVENIRERLAEWGLSGSNFERKISQAIGDLGSTEHKKFHRGLHALGQMLGFQADLPDGDGEPDCVWEIGGTLCVVHEAKSEHSPGDPIGINDIRQAQSHEDWVRANRSFDKGSEVLCLIESPRETIASEAIPYAKSLCYVSPERLRALLGQIVAVLRRVRSRSPGLSDEKLLEHLMQEIQTAKLTPKEVVQRLSGELVSQMQTSQRKKVRQ
ncbi:MAG TPA: hypothetical protein VIW92_02180, partial [Thermoanaerobaculia bacterium]